MLRNVFIFCITLMVSSLLLANYESVDIVSFYPSLAVNDSIECQGIRISKNQLALTQECENAVRMQSGKSITVLGKNKEVLGALYLDNQKNSLYQSPPYFLKEASLLGSADDEEGKIKNNFSNNIKYLNSIDTASYSAVFFNSNEVSSIKVGLDTSKYPFSVSGIGKRMLPSGTPVLDKHNKIQCLLVSNGSCEIFHSNLNPWIRNNQKKHHPQSPKEPSGDCCHPATPQIHQECITYCNANPTHCTPCPDCQRKSKESSFEFVVASSVAAAVAIVTSITVMVLSKTQVHRNSGYTSYH